MIQNAIIKYTFLGREDHGIPTFQIGLAGDVWVQAAGGRKLGDASVLIDILDTLMVASWEKLPGTHCRVIADETIRRIGHIIEDRWFDFESGTVTKEAGESA